MTDIINESGTVPVIGFTLIPVRVSLQLVQVHCRWTFTRKPGWCFSWLPNACLCVVGRRQSKTLKASWEQLLRMHLSMVFSGLRMCSCFVLYANEQLMHMQSRSCQSLWYRLLGFSCFMATKISRWNVRCFMITFYGINTIVCQTFMYFSRLFTTADLID